MTPNAKVTYIVGDAFVAINWYWSSKRSAMPHIKKRAILEGSDEFILHYGDVTEHYERHGTRWFKL